MIYDKVKEICEEKGISIRSVETAAGLSNGAISKWNSVIPKVDNAQAVAKALGVTVDELLKE